MAVRLMMLGSSPRGGVAVDVDSGALVRAHWTERAPVFKVYEVVEADPSGDDSLAFAADSLVASGPVSVGRMSGRAVTRLLKPLTHPAGHPLLGSWGPAVKYWSLRLDRPTVALVMPAAGPVVERDRKQRLRCRFVWRRLDHNLPLADPQLEQRLSLPTASRMAGGTLARALGWQPERLLVVLTPPRQGFCDKVVAGLLPQP